MKNIDHNAHSNPSNDAHTIEEVVGARHGVVDVVAGSDAVDRVAVPRVQPRRELSQVRGALGCDDALAIGTYTNALTPLRENSVEQVNMPR